RHGNSRATLEPCGIAARQFAATPGPLFQVRELHVEDCSLKPVQATVDPLHDVLALRQAAMPGEARHPLGQGRVVRDDGAGITHGPEVLAWVEGKGRRVPEGPDLPAVERREMRLG